MERTMSFSDWVNEYKPIEFNDARLMTSSAHIENIDNRIGFNIISKYLTSNHEFPMSHLSRVHIMNKCIWSPSTGLWTVDPSNEAAHFIPTYICCHWPLKFNINYGGKKNGKNNVFQ